MLAEAVHIDGTVLAVFLALAAIVIVSYVMYVIGGYFVIARGTSPGRVVLIGIVSAIDLLSIVAAVPTGREEPFGWGLLIGPAVHGVAWVRRLRQAPPGS